jgi:peptide/nickel transport system substrate-binding protein
MRTAGDNVKHSAKFGKLLIAAALAALGGSCGGGGSGGAAAPAATPVPPSASSNQINKQPREQVKDGGTLTWPLDQIPTNFNYWQLDGSLLDNGTVVSALLPSMFLFDATATPSFNPDYLTADPVVTIAPQQVVKYVINPKARWDDGSPITWEDFHWQWQAANGKNQAYQISSSNGYSEIENVERGVDDREVIVTFTQPYADWQALFSPLVPASSTRDPKVFNEGWKDRPLLTAGPFVFEGLDRTAQTITVVRNDKWWGNRAKLDRIVFRAIPDHTAQIDALANGEIDLVDVGPDANVYNRAQTIDGVEIRKAAGPNFRHITVNGSGPILKDVKVRQALAMAIDRGAIGRALLGPLGIDTKPLGNHIYMANQAGYQDNSGALAYDPARAQQMLDEAGWKLEGKVRMKDGRPLEISIVIPGGVTTSRQESELLQNMLGRIGVTLKIDVVPSPDFFDKYVNVGQFDFTVFSWIGTPFPVGGAKSIYVKPKPNPNGGFDIQQNYARVGSDEIDELFDKATAELDRAKAVEIANRIDTLLWEEVHSLTLYQRPELWACKKGLANIGAFGFAVPVYEDIGWTSP